MSAARRVLVTAVAMLGFAAPAATADTLPYQDPSLPVSQRVADLLSRMTLAEKIGQMTQTERYQVYDDATPITTYGLGSILEGAGVADDLFGVQPYSGRLPVSWPRSLSQEPINKGDANYDPLYRFGYGLTTG